MNNTCKGPNMLGSMRGLPRKGNDMHDKKKLPFSVIPVKVKSKKVTLSALNSIFYHGWQELLLVRD